MQERSFVRGLFTGIIDDALIFPWPQPLDSEVDALRKTLDGVRFLCEEHVDAAAIDQDGRIPTVVLDDMKRRGLFGLLVPQSYGGAGLTTTGYTRVIQEIAAADASLALTLDAHQVLGLRGLVLFGTETQKARFLPRLARGEAIAAFALSERGAGSDAAAIQTRAEREADGSYRVTGSKSWVTNGGFADVFMVFARTSPAEEGNKPRITAFLVERSEGVSSGPDQPKLGVRGSSTSEVGFDGVRVPAENLVGEVGRGFKVAMAVLNGGRVALAGGCLGVCKRVIRMSVERCRERRAFGRAIGEFGLVKDKIALMMAETWALESMTYATAARAEGGSGDFAIESAVCKVFGSETGRRVVDEGLQIAAGAGYMTDLPYERMLRDMRLTSIFGATNEILRTFIALTAMVTREQGAEAAALEFDPSLLVPGDAGGLVGVVKRPLRGFGRLSEAALRRAKSALSRQHLTRQHPILRPQAEVFDAYVEELAQAVQAVMRKHGKNVVEMQYTQRRVADLAIDLYAIATCLSRTTRAIARRGEEGAQREIDFTRIFVASARTRLAGNVAAMEDNDDELRKAVASRTYVDGGYGFDVI